jgi:hypothetical protein
MEVSFEVSIWREGKGRGDESGFSCERNAHGREVGRPRSARPCHENFVCDKSPSCGVISLLKTKKTEQELARKMR